MKSKIFIFTVLIAAWLISACKPEISTGENLTEPLIQGKDKLIGAFSIKASSASVTFKGICLVEYDKNLTGNIRIMKKGDSFNYPIGQFSYILKANESAVFNVFADIEAVRPCGISIAIDGFTFTFMSSGKALVVSKNIIFSRGVAPSGKWEIGMKGTESVPESAGVAINGKGAAFVLAGSNVYGYSPQNGFLLTADDTHGIPLRLIIDDDGNSIGIWKMPRGYLGNVHYYSIRAMRYSEGKPVSETINITDYSELEIKGYTAEISAASNSKGETCLMIDENNKNGYDSLEVYRLSTKDGLVQRTVINGGDRRSYQFNSPGVAVAENGDIAAIWIEGNRRLYALFFKSSTGSWGSEPVLIRDTGDGVRILECGITAVGTDSFAAVWTEEKFGEAMTDKFSIHSVEISTDSALPKDEPVFTGSDRFDSPKIAASETSRMITCTGIDGFLYAAVKNGSAWQPPFRISTGELAEPVTSLHADDGGNFLAGYVTEEYDRQYLNSSYFDVEENRLQHCRLGTYRFTYKPDALPIAMSRSGNAVAAWGDVITDGLNIGFYK
jgi:hypothetical protein